MFIVRNSASSGTITVSGASTIPGPGYVVVRSNGTTWDVIEGAYRPPSRARLLPVECGIGAWRLIAYDTGGGTCPPT